MLRLPVFVFFVFFYISLWFCAMGFLQKSALVSLLNLTTVFYFIQSLPKIYGRHPAYSQYGHWNFWILKGMHTWKFFGFKTWLLKSCFSQAYYISYLQIILTSSPFGEFDLLDVRYDTHRLCRSAYKGWVFCLCALPVHITGIAGLLAHMFVYSDSNTN